MACAPARTERIHSLPGRHLEALMVARPDPRDESASALAGGRAIDRCQRCVPDVAWNKSLTARDVDVGASPAVDGVGAVVTTWAAAV